jgi:hypothetical protein
MVEKEKIYKIRNEKIESERERNEITGTKKGKGKILS